MVIAMGDIALIGTSAVTPASLKTSLHKSESQVPAICTHHLTKRYGKARGIEDVNLTVQQGEIFGFIGPNGAGKSTTIRTLLGLIRATSGDASILGLDYVRDRTHILEQVGYLPSEVHYYDGMRARDLLQYAASFYHVDCSRRAQELASRLDLDLNQKIEDMSLGNRKKVGIVQGLMHEPRLIILDEPTSGLDPLMQRTFFDIIREEQQRGATVLFSSHILSEVQRICDRVAIIRDGRIVAVQSVSQLRQSAVKRVTLALANSNVAMAKHTLTAMTGVRSLTVDGVSGDDAAAHTAVSSVSFLYEGDCNALVAALANLTLADIEIAEPTLEEVFMHYYQPTGAAGSAGSTATAGGVSDSAGKPATSSSADTASTPLSASLRSGSAQ